MLFNKKKLLLIFVILIDIVGFDISLAKVIDDGALVSTSSEIKKDKTNLNIINKEENKQANYKKYIKDLGFYRSLNGGSVFEVIFKENINISDNYKTQLSQDGRTLTIIFENAAISDKWISNIDAKVFNTMVDYIKIYQENDSVIFVVHSFEQIEFTNFKENNVVKFKIDRRKSRIEGFNINEPVTISFKDAPIHTVLQVLSDLVGLNLVVSNNVVGNISIDLKNVPWNEVMKIVLISKGLATKKMDSILYVATVAEIAAQEQIELQVKQALENNATLVTKFIPLNYTTAKTAKTTITSMAKQNGGIMSLRGSITSDVRTNTLIVTDIEDKIPRIEEIINEIDIPNDQVLIESRIVEINRGTKLELGLNYNLVDSTEKIKIGLNTFQLPKNALGSTVKFGYTVFGGMKLNVEIQALETEALANSVASPHLIVANNETAFIKQGSYIPYNQSTASGAASIAFQEAVLKLQVTPRIVHDGNIILKILVTKNSIGASSGKTASGSDLPPIIEKREIATKIMTKDGQTIVIGGIYEQSHKKSRTKIAILGDIPYLGHLFSYTEIKNNDKELLIFITPKVLQTKREI